MKITHIISLTLLTLTIASRLSAQGDCVVKLNEAEKLYEAGNIEQIPSLLESCIAEGFNREDKIQAIKLLTLVYLSEDNTIKAEKSLLQLLKIDPEYKVNQAIDPVEFIKLYNSYNTSPVFSLGAIITPGIAMPLVTESFGKNSFADLNTKYKAGGVSIAIGIKSSYHVNPFWDISFEPSFSIQSFSVSENIINKAEGNLIENLNSIYLPLACSYYFYKINNYSFYAETGVSYDRYISGKINGSVVYSEEQTNEEPSEFNTQNLRPEYNITGILGAGAKLKLNRNNFQIGLRYKFGFINQGNPEAFNPDFSLLTWDYSYIDNNFLLNNLSITLSFNREFYIHRKKPNNQTNYDILR